MITVVNENEYLPFDGMSIDEACAEMEMDVSEALNEMEMDILLNEHAYLRETGTDLQYVYEAADGAMYLTEDGKSFKNTVLGTISYAWERIKEMFLNLIDWISVKASEIKDQLTKIGINERKFGIAINTMDENRDDYSFSTNYVVAYDPFLNAINSGSGLFFYEGIDEKDYVKGDIWDEYTNSVNNKKVNFSKKEAEDAKNVIFSKDKIIKEIRSTMRIADAALKQLKKNADGSAVSSDELAKIKNATKANSKVASEAIKVYHQHFRNCCAIARVVLKTPAAKDAIKYDNKDRMKHPIDTMHNNYNAARDKRKDTRDQRKDLRNFNKEFNKLAREELKTEEGRKSFKKSGTNMRDARNAALWAHRRGASMEDIKNAAGYDEED